MSTSLLFVSFRSHASHVYQALLTFSALLGAYFCKEAFSTESVSVPIEGEADFQLSAPKSAADFLEMAHEQMTPHIKSVVAAATPPPPDPAIQFMTLPVLGPQESELRFFDDLALTLPAASKTLVISHLHGKIKDSPHTLANYLAYTTPFHQVICSEIVPGFDLIPYAGRISGELAFRASLFMSEQLRNYKRIIFLLPSDLQQEWKMAASFAPGADVTVSTSPDENLTF